MTNSTLNEIVLEAKELVKKQDKALKKNKDTIEPEAIEFIRRISEKKITKSEASFKDTIFINHIQSHLAENEVVICKICGLSAESIISLDKDRYIDKFELREIIISTMNQLKNDPNPNKRINAIFESENLALIKFQRLLFEKLKIHD